jgi:hypothetical protein
MTATVIDLAAARARRAEEAAAREAAKAAAIAKAQPQPEPARSNRWGSLRRSSKSLPTWSPSRSKWRVSARGNPWTRIGPAHIVVFASRQT